MELIGTVLGFYLPLLAGFIYGRFFNGKSFSRGMSKITLYFFLPLLLYDSIARRHVDFSLNMYWFMLFFAIYITLISFIPSILIFKNDRNLVMVSIYINAGFLPIPLAYSLWGAEAVSLIGFFILGQIIIINFIIPLLVSSNFVDGFKRLLKFPPIYALIVGLISSSFNLLPSPSIMNVISDLGNVAPKLALLTLGADASGIEKLSWNGFKVAFIRIICSPLFTVPLLLLLKIRGLPFMVVLLESMMPPAVANIIFANEFNLDVDKIANAVITSTIIATLIIPPIFFTFT